MIWLINNKNISLSYLIRKETIDTLQIELIMMSIDKIANYLFLYWILSEYFENGNNCGQNVDIK